MLLILLPTVLGHLGQNDVHALRKCIDLLLAFSECHCEARQPRYFLTLYLKLKTKLSVPIIKIIFWRNLNFKNVISHFSVPKRVSDSVKISFIPLHVGVVGLKRGHFLLVNVWDALLLFLLFW